MSFDPDDPRFKNSIEDTFYLILQELKQIKAILAIIAEINNPEDLTK